MSPSILPSACPVPINDFVVSQSLEVKVTVFPDVWVVPVKVFVTNPSAELSEIP